MFNRTERVKNLKKLEVRVPVMEGNEDEIEMYICSTVTEQKYKLQCIR